MSTTLSEGRCNVEFSRRVEDVVLVDLEPMDSSINQAAPAPGPCRNTTDELWQKVVREGTRKLEGQMARGVIKICQLA